jgi:hypothetical protein
VNTIGIVAVDALAAKIALPLPVAAIAATDQIGSERRQLCVLVFREAVFDRQVMTFNVTALTQAATESLSQAGAVISSQPG